MATRALSLAAVDLGAESGRVLLGRLDDGVLRLQEIRRFANEPVRATGRLYWDILRLYLEVMRGIAAARRANQAPLDGVSVDTWGVDFGLLASNGELIANPYHYRDEQTEGAMEEVFARIPARRIFEITGIQMMPLNTLFQLYAMKRANSPFLAAAKRLLMLPGLFTYFLTGEELDEFTAATTSQLYDAREKSWSKEILDSIGVPRDLFATVCSPGTVVGPLQRRIADEFGFEQVPVILGAGHDTACAVAAVPAEPVSAGAAPAAGSWAYISCGTWSLVGTEVTRPIISDEAFSFNLANEGGVFGTFRLLKNVMGLWLLRQCREEWARAGQEFGYADLVELARRAPGRRSFVDPDDPGFLRPGGIVARIQDFCRRTGQPVPEEPGEVVRTVLESLALKYRWVIERLEEVTGVGIGRVHLVGGGARNELLCQLTADVTGRPLLAGPTEATAAGNLLMQAVALGEVGSLEELREIVRRSFLPRLYEPSGTSDWEEPYAQFCERLLPPRPLAG